MDKNSDDHDLSTNTLVPINDPNDHIIEENNYTIEHTSDGPAVINMPDLSCDLDPPKKHPALALFPARIADIPLPGEIVEEIPLPPVTTHAAFVTNSVKVDSSAPMETAMIINDSAVTLNESNGSNASCNFQLQVSSEDADVSMESAQSIEGLHITGDDVVVQETATESAPALVPTEVELPVQEDVQQVVEEEETPAPVEQPPVVKEIAVQDIPAPPEVLRSPDITVLKMEDDEVEEIVGDYTTAPLAVKKGTVRRGPVKEKKQPTVETVTAVQTTPKPTLSPSPTQNTNQKTLNDITAEAVMDEEEDILPEHEDDLNTILPHNTKHSTVATITQQPPVAQIQQLPKKQAAIMEQQVVVEAAGEDGKPVYYLKTVDENGVVVMHEAELLVEGEDDEEDEEADEGEMRLVQMEAEEGADEDPDYQEAENIQLYITSDDIGDDLEPQSPDKAGRDIIPSHLQGRTVNAPSRDSVKNGKAAPKPRLGVKVPYKNLTSQIVSKAEITEAIMERSMRTNALRTATMQQATASRSSAGLNLFSKKMTKRLATKIFPDDEDEDDADDPNRGHELQPLAKKKAYIPGKGGGAASGRRMIVGESGTEDLLAILEGNEDEKGHHHPTATLIHTPTPISNQRIQQQLTAAEERAIALKQLQAIDSDTDDEVEDIHNIQATLKRHQAATGQIQSSRRINARERDLREAREAAAMLQRQNRTSSQSSSTSTDSKGGSHGSSAARVVGSKVVVQSVEPVDGGTPVKRPRGRPKKVVPQVVVVEDDVQELENEEMVIQTIEDNSVKESVAISEAPRNQAPSSGQQSQTASVSKNAETPAESPRIATTRVNSEPEPKFASHVPLKTYARKRKPSETGTAQGTEGKGEYDFVEEVVSSDKAGGETSIAPVEKSSVAKTDKTEDLKKVDKGKDKEKEKEKEKAKEKEKEKVKDKEKEKESSSKKASSIKDTAKTPSKDLKTSNTDKNKQLNTPKKAPEVTKKVETPKITNKEETLKVTKKIEDLTKSSKKTEEPPKPTNKKQEDSKVVPKEQTKTSKKPIEEPPAKPIPKESTLKSSVTKKIEDTPSKTISSKKEDTSSAKDKKEDTPTVKDKKEDTPKAKDKIKDNKPESTPKSTTKTAADKEKVVEKTPTIPPTMHMTKSARVIKKKVIWDPDDAGSPLRPPVKSFPSNVSTSSTTSSTSSIGEKEKTPAKIERKVKSTDNKQKVEEKVQTSAKKIVEKVVEVKKPEETKPVVVETKVDAIEELDTSPAISPAKKRKLHEVAKLLKDEGAINMLYSLKSTQNDDAEAGNMRSSRRNRDFLGKASDLYEDLTTISSMDSPKALRKKAGPIIHEKKKRAAAPMMARKKSGDSYRSSNHSAPASPQYDASRIIRRRSSSSFGSLDDGQDRDEFEEEEEEEEDITEDGDTEGSVIDVDKDETLTNDSSDDTPLVVKQTDKDIKPSATPINNNRRKQTLTTPTKTPISPKRQKTTVPSTEPPNIADSDRTNITTEIQQTLHEEPQQDKEVTVDKKAASKKSAEEEAEETEEDEALIDLAARLKDWEGVTVMENEFVKMTQREHAWKITLLEGGKYDGKLNFEILKQLTTLLTDLETNDKCRVVILTSTTPSFCTGVSFTTLFNQNEQIALRNSTELAFIIRKFLIALVKFPKPLVAGIKGGCNSGLGCTMLPLFDVVISADTATFSACPDALSKRCCLVEGGSLLTGSNLVQHTLVSELLFVGGKLTAAQALRYGLVTRVVWPSNYDLEVHRTVSNIGSHSLEFLKSTKKQTRQHTIATIVEQIKAETDTLIKHWTSVDCQQQFQQLQKHTQTQS